MQIPQIKMPFEIEGTVVSGKGLGRKLGFPTINLDVGASALPPDGVYAAHVLLEEKALPAAAFVSSGHKDSQNKSIVEAHILDFRGDLYGRKARLRCESFLRPPKDFKSHEELRRAIAADVVRVREILVKQPQ